MSNKCNAYDENRDNYVKCCNNRQKKEDNESTRVLLKCGTQGGVTIIGELIEDEIPTENAELALFGFNTGTGFNVASVSIDTRGFSHPNIKIQFACNIEIIADLIIADTLFTLNFQLFKQCSNQLVPVPVGTPWTYSNLLVVGGQSDTFGFTICDHPCDNECCNYIVVVTPAPGSDTTVFAGLISINNAILTALAVDGSSCNC